MRCHNSQENPPWLGCCKRILVYKCIGVTSISLIAILDPLNKMICCTKSRLQNFRVSSVVQGKRFEIFISSILFLVNHLILLDYVNSYFFILSNYVWFVRGKLAGRVVHNKQQILGRSLKVQNQMKRNIMGSDGFCSKKGNQRWYWTWNAWIWFEHEHKMI